MRAILLHAHDDAAFDTRLQVALDLARAFDGHVTCLQAVSLDFAMAWDYDGILSAEMAQVMRERAEAFRTRSEARLAAEDVRWEWDDRIGLGDSVMQEYAALSDVVVVGSGAPENPAVPSWLAGALAIHARVPVLAVPQGCTGLQCDAQALVCWNGSVESSRALRAAMPLLALARSVTLATVGDGETASEEEVDFPPVHGAEYLARHGIDCEIVRLPWTSRKDVAGQLREAARARNAGLVVMGALPPGHSRMLETLLGGVTREMLTHSSVPLLMAN